MSKLTGKQFLIIEWSWVVITLGLILTRFRIRYQRRKGFNICDTFVAFGWMFFLAQACMDIVLYKKGWYDGKIDPEASEFGPEHGLATYRDTVIVLKILYTETSLYYMTMYMVKYAMLFLYYEIIPPHLRHLRLATHITLALTFVGGTSTVLMKIFWCLPINMNWAVAGNYCENITSVTNTVYEWAWHMLTDTLIYLIPIFIVRNLQLPLAQKIGVALTFSSGFVCIFFANLVQISYIIIPAPAPLSWIYSAAEMTWALIVVCLPAFKIFLTKDVWVGWLRAKRRISMAVPATKRTSKESKGSSMESRMETGDGDIRPLPPRTPQKPSRMLLNSLDIITMSETRTECCSPISPV